MNAEHATPEVIDALAGIEMQRKEKEKESGVPVSCNWALGKLYQLLPGERKSLKMGIALEGDFEGLRWRASRSRWRSSPGRTGRAQRSWSSPAPRMPPAGWSSLSTRSRMVIAAVCQPLAASARNIEPRAASSSRWKGCGSNSAAKALIRSFSTRKRPEPKVCPTAKSSRYRPVIAAVSSVDLPLLRRLELAERHVQQRVVVHLQSRRSHDRAAQGHRLHRAPPDPA